MAKKEKDMGRVDIAILVAQMVPWDKLIDKAPDILREARGMLPSFKWRTKLNDQQKLTVETLSETIGHLESALEEQAMLIESMSEQSIGMIAKIKELDEANHKLLIAQQTMTNKVYVSLGLTLVSIVIAAAAILR